MEYWKNIKGYKGKYQVSNMGRVKSFHHGKERILKPAPSNKGGHLGVVLYVNEKRKTFFVHKLVAETFLDNINRDNGYHICHKNGIVTDNRLINFRFDTPTQNRIDEYRNGGSYFKNGLNKYQVYAIRELYKIGYSQKKLSRMFECDYRSINQIINKKIFTFIDDDGTIADSKTGFDMHDRVKQLTFKSGKLDSGKHGIISKRNIKLFTENITDKVA